MSLVIDTLRTSAVTEELSDSEVEILAGLFDVQSYKAGEVIVHPGDEQPDNLYILAYGDIEMKIESDVGETIIHVLKPGDLAGMITFAGGAASHVNATLYAVGDTKVLSLERAKFETLINTHPMIVYRVMRGVIRNMHGIVRRVNSESNELSNYIYRSHGRY
jgi:CRP-like cAMP-binding protein